MTKKILLGAISFLLFPVGWGLGLWYVFRKKQRVFGGVLIALGFLEIILFSIMPSSEAPSEPVKEQVIASSTALSELVATKSPPTPILLPAPTPTLIPVSTATLTMGEDEKTIAISVITGYELVKEAAITQKDKKFSLVVIVNYATNEKTAKEIGENFVRQVMTFGPDESPSLKEIGKGKFDYVVGVYYPDETKVVLGAKNRNATKVTW